jgi:hypothetical protein
VITKIFRRIVAVGYLAAVLVAPATAATCVAGFPLIRAQPVSYEIACNCFARDPKGTAIYAINVISINVPKPMWARVEGNEESFGTQFDQGVSLTCDRTHLFVWDPELGRHAYPLPGTELTGGIAEQAVPPGMPIDAHLRHLIETGRARRIGTL